MFGLIGHLTSLEHAQSVAKELGYPEYADQGLDFWCNAGDTNSIDYLGRSATPKI